MDKDEVEKQIRVAAAAGKVVFPGSDVVDRLDYLIAGFLAGTFDVWSYMLTDLSTLSDFSPSGLPQTIASACDGDAAMRAAWDQWVLGVVKRCYGIDIATTEITFADLFTEVERHR